MSCHSMSSAHKCLVHLCFRGSLSSILTVFQSIVDNRPCLVIYQFPYQYHRQVLLLRLLLCHDENDMNVLFSLHLVKVIQSVCTCHYNLSSHSKACHTTDKDNCISSSPIASIIQSLSDYQ